MTTAIIKVAGVPIGMMKSMRVSVPSPLDDGDWISVEDQLPDVQVDCYILLADDCVARTATLTPLTSKLTEKRIWQSDEGRFFHTVEFWKPFKTWNIKGFLGYRK